MPVNIPEEYILFSIRVTEYNVSLWFLPEEHLGSEMDIINAIAFGQHFLLSVTRGLNLENPMVGVLEQHRITDEPLNSSRRTRNGHRRPTVGASGFDLNTVITGALINSLAVNGNIDLYAVWVQWGDVNDDGVVNGLDVSLVSQYVRRFPGISIVRPALYVSRNTMVTGLDVSLISQDVRRFPGIVLV